VRVHASRLQPDDVVTKLVVRVDGVQIKIEVTPVLRGCVFDPEPRDVSPAVEDRFGFATARLVSFADLYAGKIVAARAFMADNISASCALRKGLVRRATSKSMPSASAYPETISTGSCGRSTFKVRAS